MAEPMCPSCGAMQMRTFEIKGASRKSSYLLWLSIVALILSVISFASILYSLWMTIAALFFYISHRVILGKSGDLKLTEFKCMECGWSNMPN